MAISHVVGLRGYIAERILSQNGSDVLNITGGYDLPSMIAQCRELDVKFIACEMAMNVMGLQREELLDDVDEVAGVAKLASLTSESGATLFI